MLNINIFSSTSEMNMNGCGIYLGKIYIFWKIKKDIFSFLKLLSRPWMDWLSLGPMPTPIPRQGITDAKLPPGTHDTSGDWRHFQKEEEYYSRSREGSGVELYHHILKLGYNKRNIMHLKLTSCTIQEIISGFQFFIFFCLFCILFWFLFCFVFYHSAINPGNQNTAD